MALRQGSLNIVNKHRKAFSSTNLQRPHLSPSIQHCHLHVQKSFRSRLDFHQQVTLTKMPSLLAGGSCMSHALRMLPFCAQFKKS